MSKRTLFLLFISTLFTACAGFFGPDYKRPNAPTKPGWSLNPGDASRGSEVIRLDWWTEFNDPYLNALVEKAISQNLSIQTAFAKLDVARGGIATAKAPALPTISGNAGIRGQVSGTFGGKTTTPSSPQAVLLTTPGRGQEPALISPLGTPEKPESTTSSLSDQLGTSLSWELDLWGKLAKGIEASKAQYKASEAEWRFTWLSIVAGVAEKYFRIRQIDEQIDQQRKSLAQAQKILRFYQMQAREGLRPETDVMTQQAEVNDRQTQLLDLQLNRTRAENELATLVGTPAGDFKLPPAALQTSITIPDVPTGLPSDLLSRRPDIVQAEYEVLAAHELLGKARLAKLPSIELNLSGGADNLLSAAIKQWTFGVGPNIKIPLFDPNIEADIKIRGAEQKLAEARYREAVIKAFEEAENALANLYHHKKQRQEIIARKKHLERVAALIRAQVKAGIASQLQVLETERTLLQASQDLLTNYQQILSDTITLYKVLGGGWPPVIVEPEKRQIKKAEEI